jgi:hypothetical protein
MFEIHNNLSENTIISGEQDTIERAKDYEGRRFVKRFRMRRLDKFEKVFARRVFALAYNLGYFLEHLALSKRAKEWSLRTLRVKLIKIGTKVISHSMYVIFQMAEVLVSKRLFQEILESIHRLKPVPIWYG